MAVSSLYLVHICVRFFLYICLQRMRWCLETAKRRYIRNPNENFNAGEELIFVGEAEQFDDNAFVPVEVKAGKIIESHYIVYIPRKFLFPGDAIVMDGQVVHKSEQSIKYRIESIFYHIHVFR